MIIRCQQFHVELKRGSIFELSGSSGNKLTCRMGTIWVTQHDRCEDWVLQRGECLTLDVPGQIVISACDEIALFSIRECNRGRALGKTRLYRHPGQDAQQETSRAYA